MIYKGLNNYSISEGSIIDIFQLVLSSYKYIISISRSLVEGLQQRSKVNVTE